MGRRVIVIGFGAAAGLLGLGSTAWACTSTPSMTLQPAAGVAAADAPLAPGAFVAAAPASTITVNVRDGAWAPAEAVQIHWNGLAGPLLATTEGRNFSTVVEVPRVAPGVYYVTATGSAGGTRVSQALEITGPGAGPAPVPPASLATPASPSGDARLMVGAAVLGGGLVAAFSVVALATVGRRRAAAHAR